MNANTYFTPNEVKLHAAPTDCWLSKFGRVYDYTNLVKASPTNLVVAIVKTAGQDVSEWFDVETGDFPRVINALDGNLRFRLPLGLPTLHTPDVYAPI